MEFKNVEILDEAKQSISCEISFPNTSNLHCFWDRHKITDDVIRCPLRYKPKQIVKVYKSEISKEQYTIKENVVKFPSSESKHANLKTIPESLEVSDAFCSFNCCLSWIRDNKHDRKYDQSEMLLHTLFKNATKTHKQLIPSPHWRTLIVYGGFQTIEQFRSKIQKTIYTYNGPILNTGFLFSKQLNLN